MLDEEEEVDLNDVNKEAKLILQTQLHQSLDWPHKSSERGHL